jgi:uncharacterized membrane protein YtjA (UPF0391 family)
MLRWAVIFLIVALTAAILGLGGIASGAAVVGQILLYICLSIVVVLMLVAIIGGGWNTVR